MSWNGFWDRTWLLARELYHCWLGAFLLRRGQLNRAKAHFQSVLARREASFQAHLYLGRIYLSEDRWSRAFEELLRARDLDPRRFAREGFPGDQILMMAERLPEPHRSSSLADTTTLGRQPRADEDPDPLLGVDDLPFGDFSGREEAERFSLLPPLALSDAVEVDWDALSRELSAGE